MKTPFLGVINLVVTTVRVCSALFRKFLGSRLLIYLTFLVVAYMLTSCSLLEKGNSTQSRGGQTTPGSVNSPQPTSTSNRIVKFSKFSTPTSVSKTQIPTLSPVTPTSQPTSTQQAAPEFTSDLFFISGDELVRWDYVTDSTITLAENVIDYSYSTDGRRIAMLRSASITANGEELLNLDLLDLHTKKISSLVRGIASLNQIAISPNGQWIAYQVEDDATSIWGIAVNQPESPIKLGQCSKEPDEICKPLLWAPDGYSLLWEDSQGLWLSKPEKPRPVLIAPHLLNIIDPKGQQAQINVEFSEFQWSPKGRYGISQLITEAGVSWFAVLDCRQGSWLEIPETFQNGSFASTAVGWLDDGKIAVINPSNAVFRPGLSINLYNFSPTSKQAFTLEQEIFLSSDQLPTTAQEEEKDNIAGWLKQSADQVISFGITTRDGNKLSLFWVNLEKEQLEKSQQLEIKPATILWSPDGQGTLILNEFSQAIFFNKGGAEFIPLNEISDQKISNFRWASPSPRS